MKQTLSSGRVKLSLATGLLYIFCLFQLVYSASNDTEIVLNNSLIEGANLSDTFYLVDRTNVTSPPVTEVSETEDRSSEDNHADEFWERTVPVTASTAATTPLLNDEVSFVTFRVTVTSTPGPPTTTTTVASPTTTATPSTVSSSTRVTSTTPRPTSASTLATVRLHSNILTVKPVETHSRSSTTKKPKKNKNKLSPKNEGNSIDTVPSKEKESVDELDRTIWKMTLHGTNMNSEELRMVNSTLLEVHFKPYSRRKVARVLKKDLDSLFGKYNYRFSIIVSTTSRNTMGRAFHGVWLSMSINGIHYFLTATYRLVDGPTLREEDLGKIEYWSSVHSIQALNMTGYRRYNRIATKLKLDLDRQFGNGNVWSVVIVKNRYLVKAKALEDTVNRVEFTRLNGGHFIVFRGGQNIDDTSRNARYVSMTAEKDDEETSEHSFREFDKEGSR